MSDLTVRVAETLCVHAATLVGATSTSTAQPARRTGRARTGSAPAITLTLGGQAFSFSPVGHLHPAGHAIAFHAFLTHCREALLALASKTIEANGLRLEQYYPIITQAPEGGTSSLAKLMPTNWESDLEEGRIICVPAPGMRTLEIGVEGKIEKGNDPYHDGFIALLLKCDARLIRVCEVCLDFFYARTLDHRGCRHAHSNRISQRIFRRREKGDFQSESGAAQAGEADGQKAGDDNGPR